MISLARDRRQEPAASAGRTFRSPGLALVAERLRTVERPLVLDLGAPRRANVEFLAGAGTKVWIEDLPHFLVGRSPPRPEDDAAPDWDRFVAGELAFDRSARLDVVLAWDLLSYLEVDAIRALMREVAAACSPGTLLFITVSTAEALAERPASIRVGADATLVYEPSGPGTRPNPAYTPLALERLMPGFRLLHSFMLGDGMQDYLFSFQGA